MNEFPSDPDQPLNDSIVPPCSPVADGPRQRVSAHMKRLLKSAAAGAAMSTSAALICVDPPPPPPPDCSMPLTDDDLARSVNMHAWWATVGGAPVVRTNLSAYFGTGLEFSGSPTLQGGTLGGVVFTDRDLTFLLTPDEGVTSVQVAVPMSCDTFPVGLNLSLDVSSSREPGSLVPVRIGTP